jgi:hypothetical protein
MDPTAGTTMAGESKPDDGSADTVLTDVASLLIEALFNVGALTEANDMINNMKRVVVDRPPNTTVRLYALLNLPSPIYIPPRALFRARCPISKMLLLCNVQAFFL